MPPLKRTQKREEELYNELYNNAVRRLRGMLPPQSIAEAMYPKLKTDAQHRREEALTKERK